MARDAKLFVRIADDQTAAQLARAGHAAVREREWLHVSGSDYTEETARELSMTLATTTVWWTIESSTDQISLTCFHYGIQVRRLHYAAVGGWTQTYGRPQPFEAASLAELLARRDLRAAHGYAVLDSFLGAPQASTSLSQ